MQHRPGPPDRLGERGEDEQREPEVEDEAAGSSSGMECERHERSNNLVYHRRPVRVVSLRFHTSSLCITQSHVPATVQDFDSGLVELTVGVASWTPDLNPDDVSTASGLISPRPANDSKMHRVWHIAELRSYLAGIIKDSPIPEASHLRAHKNANNITLLTLARTCTLFCDPCVAAMWSELPSLLPLLALMCEKTVHVSRYGRRTVRLRHSIRTRLKGNADWAYHKSVNLSLLPQLESLDWTRTSVHIRKVRSLKVHCSNGREDDLYSTTRLAMELFLQRFIHWGHLFIKSVPCEFQLVPRLT